MHKLVIVVCLAVSTIAFAAEPPTAATAKSKASPPAAVAAIPPVIKDLPVRKVVLLQERRGLL